MKVTLINEEKWVEFLNKASGLYRSFYEKQYLFNDGKDGVVLIPRQETIDGKDHICNFTSKQVYENDELVELVIEF